MELFRNENRDKVESIFKLIYTILDNDIKEQYTLEDICDKIYNLLDALENGDKEAAINIIVLCFISYSS